MTTPTNHWKLGMFVVVGSVCAIGFLFWLGTQSFRKKTVTYVSFFDETVTGLDVGSPVAFRGVNIGNVSDISIAPDRRHVETQYDLSVSVLTRMGLVQTVGDEVHLKIPDDIRVQVSSAGITGAKYLKLDFLANVPVPKLSFPVPENYIPASPSTLKNLEDSVTKALDSLPVVVDKLLALLDHADGLLLDFKNEGLPGQASVLLANASRTVDSLQHSINQVDTAGISQQTSDALLELRKVLQRADVMIARVNGEAGILDSVQRATDAVGDVAGNARSTGPKLDQTLDNVSELAHSIERLLDALERDSDMLLKGRARSSK